MMPKYWILAVIGGGLLLLPVLGFPRSFETAFSTVSGAIIIFFAFVFRRYVSTLHQLLAESQAKEPEEVEPYGDTATPYFTQETEGDSAEANSLKTDSRLQVVAPSKN